MQKQPVKELFVLNKPILLWLLTRRMIIHSLKTYYAQHTLNLTQYPCLEPYQVREDIMGL